MQFQIIPVSLIHRPIDFGNIPQYLCGSWILLYGVSKKIQSGSAYLRSLRAERMRKATVSNSDENIAKDTVHCLIALTPKKRLVQANVGGEKERPQSIGSTALREFLRSHASVPWIENFVVWRISRPRLIGLGESGRATCYQNCKNELRRRNRGSLPVSYGVCVTGLERRRVRVFPHHSQTRKPNRWRTMSGLAGRRINIEYFTPTVG
jgi:hypothetical protein